MSFLRASYGVSIVRILEEMDRVITAPRCTHKDLPQLTRECKKLSAFLHFHILHLSLSRYL